MNFLKFWQWKWGDILFDGLMIVTVLLMIIVGIGQIVFIDKCSTKCDGYYKATGVGLFSSETMNCHCEKGKK